MLQENAMPSEKEILDALSKVYSEQVIQADNILVRGK